MADQEPSAEDIFGVALDLPPEVRLAYVDAACRDSMELHGEVVALLADHQRLGDFLAAPPMATGDAAGNRNAAAANSTVLAAGWKLGRYTIVAPLGVGGMGAVYRARDERLEREVAIKVLFSDLLLDEHSRTRFRKESLALARLSHANIAAVHDVGEENGMDYIVMECVTGQTLAATLRRGPMAVAEAVSVVRQVASALEEAHAFGVIHRDLKPANIMISTKGGVKVLDFGIAKLANVEAAGAAAGADATTCIGTPCYMSPEQVRGKPVDPRTDLWSLGIVLYESLTGRMPFCGDSIFATMQAILEATPAPVGDLRPEVPAAVAEIVARMLRKDAAARFQSAHQVVQATSAALAAAGTSA